MEENSKTERSATEKAVRRLSLRQLEEWKLKAKAWDEFMLFVDELREGINDETVEHSRKPPASHR
jgi:hypothetical protein